MSVSRWRLVTNACLLLSLGAFVTPWLGYLACALDLSDAMTRELNPLTEGALEEQVERATADVEEIPEAFGARYGLAHPVCMEAHPPGDHTLAWALFVFGIVGALFARNQVRVKSGPVRPDPRGRTRSGTSSEFERSGPLPSEIDVGNMSVGLSERDKKILDAVGDLDRRDDSLMIYLTKDEEEEEEPKFRDIDGFFCPPGYHDKPLLYVDPDHEGASDDLSGEDPVGNPDRPFETLEGAIAMSRQLLDEDEDGVMIRVMPGVYHASIDIPDRVVVVNHRLPAEGNARARLKWLTEQSVDHPDCVTILTPPESQYAVKFESGVRQGIFGCYVVGRENVKQAGIVAVGGRALAIINCVVERFAGGGIRLQDSGTELAGGAVMIHGCRIHSNESKKGAAVYGERSSITIADSILERNKAVTGGAIYGTNLRAPLVITRSRIARNRAQLDESPRVDPDNTRIEEWQRASGLGGGLYLRSSKLKVTGSEFVENGASVAGGGIAMLDSKGILERGEDNQPRFARNRSRLGAGLALIGWSGHDSTLKCSDALVERNEATVAGGGFAAVGMAIVQLRRGQFVENRITEEDGCGGAVVCWMGARLLAHEVEFLENESKGNGGAIAIVNASCKFKGDVRVRANVAQKTGGGIYAVTTSSKVAASLVERRLVKPPFVVELDETKISNNASTTRGGGLRGGNEERAATLPLKFELGDDLVFQLNRTKSQKENGDDVWIVWGGEVKATDRDRPEKIVLR